MKTYARWALVTLAGFGLLACDSATLSGGTPRAEASSGAFDAIRWAPNNSGYRYLKDCIELFEKYGWDWTYHSWRWWEGWSAEHTDDQNNPNPGPSDGGQLLKDWFAKNHKP